MDHSAPDLISNDVTDSNFEEEHCNSEEFSGEDNVISPPDEQLSEGIPQSKPNNKTTVQCDGFSVVNIENDSISEVLVKSYAFLCIQMILAC